MANFNPGLDSTNDPNYGGAAKEVNPNSFANTSNDREKNLTLFRTLGNAASTAIEGAYETIKSGVKEAVYEGVDPIRDAQGVGSAVLSTEAGAAKAAGLGKPADTEAVHDSISRLHAAYEQGKIGDTAYYAQLEAMTRSIRSRFPGFREEVDAMVHQVTGITPANALRASIENDLQRNASAQDALQKEYRHFEASSAKYLPPDYWDRKQSGKPYSEVETRAYVARQQQEEHKVDTAKANLDLLDKQNKVTEDTAISTARDGLASIGQRSMGKMLPMMEELIQRQKEGRALSPEEQNIVRAQFNQYKLAVESELNRYFDTPLQKGSDKTMGGFVKDKRAGMISDQMKIFENIEKGLFDKDAGVLQTAANELRSRQEMGALEIQKKYPVISNLANLSRQLGPAGGEIIKQVMMTDTALNLQLTSATKSVINGMGVALMTPGANGSPLTHLDDFINGNPEGKKPAAVKALVNQWANIASNPGLPRETLETAATNLFSGDSSKLLSRFNGASQLEVFRTLTNPAITENMKKVGGQAWENYSHWAKDAFVTVMRSAGDQVGTAPDSPYWKVNFNQKSNRFELSPTPEGIRFLNQKGRMATGFNIVDALSRFTGSDVKSAVDKINAGIERIEPVLKGSGFNTSEEIQKLTGFMSKYDQKNPTFWQWIMKGATPQENKPHAEETFGGVHPNFTQASGDSPRGIYERNLRWTKQGLTDKDFTTKLSDQEETEFRKWAKENKVPFDFKQTENQDYDMRGFWKGMKTGDPAAHQAMNNNDHRIHFSDKWKTPYHHSFSRESQWATPDAPTWNDKDQLVDKEGKVIFDERAPKKGESGGLSLEDPSSALSAVKAAYSAGESGDNYNRLVDTKTHPKEINLVGMPIKDVLAYQQGMLDAGNKSSAAGKYQVVSKTLRSLVREGVVSEEDKFDEATQEKIADALLERRGLKDYLDGKIPLSKFMKNLGDEWEIIKKSPAAYHKTMYELERLKLASN